jgi:putative colanic acid biosysnthesis UDP-glucose lipid carrier transferase
LPKKEIKLDSRSAIRKQNIIGIICVFINPAIAFIFLLTIINIQGANFEKHYFVLGGMAFAFLFPGKIYFEEPIQEMINRVVVNWVVVSILIILFVHLTNYIDIIDSNILLNWLVSTPLMLIAVNSFVPLIINSFYSAQQNLTNIIIVGCTPVGLKLGISLKKNHLSGMNLAGYFDDRSYERLGVEQNDLIGCFAEVAKYCNQKSIDKIFICLPLLDKPRICHLLDDLKDTTASVYFVPDIFVTDLIQSGISHIEGIPVVAICETPLIGLKALQKRLIDICLAFAILLLFSPILIWIAIKIKLSSPGPIIFVQRRYGIDGSSINVYKFRSMTVTENGDNTYQQVQKNDTRVTTFGAFLRKTSLDEFPQFINVLQGRMSIVGPRPHVVAVNENYRKLIPGYMIRHKVKPGITGWAQINGFRGGDDLDPMKGRIEHDLEYLRIWSLGLDFWIIFKTAFIFIDGDNEAY